MFGEGEIMEENRLDFLVLSALLHDVGKLLERGGNFSDARSDPVYLSSCRQAKDGHPTHLHAAHTHAFCDWLEKQFTCLSQATSSQKEWKIWCAAHHRDDESSLESTVVRVSDRLSSSEREEGQYYRRDLHRRTLLEPVLEKVYLEANSDLFATRYRYPLKPLSSQRGTFFPAEGSTLGLEEMEVAGEGVEAPTSWTHLTAKHPLISEYAGLCSGLMSDIAALASKCPHIGISDFTVTMTTLLQKYTSNVPSATNVRHPDISLFDHLRTTAAIAQGLYLFQIGQADPRKGLTWNKDAKWFLLCGDFSGIQRFIYDLTNKGAAKGLRGRSFYVRYFTKICALFIMRELGLNPIAVLYNSGGKFFALVPSTMRKELYEARRRVNTWLLKEFAAHVFFGLGIAEVSGDQFAFGKMDEAWKEAADDLENDRLNKFKDFLTPGFFDPDRSFDPSNSCSVCGSRMLEKHGAKCRTCDMLEKLGSSLKDTEAILTLWGSGGAVESAVSLLRLEPHRIVSFPDLEARCVLIPGRSAERLSEVRSVSAECTFLNDRGELTLDRLQLPECSITSMYLGRWDSSMQTKAEGRSWDFEDYAEHAEGISRLGVLRMDVDNLGMVFVKGLHFPQRQDVLVEGKSMEGWGPVVRDEAGNVLRKPMASISRMVTLSRQLDHFFSGYIPQLLKSNGFDRCQIIYAGGDDLFAIGSWDQLPGLARTIRKEFKHFCCNNPDFSISGGITLQRGKYPIYKGARLAGEAEKLAKDVRANWEINTSQYQKDGFCFLGVPVVWEDMEMAERIKTMLESDIEKNRGLLSFLIQMVASNKTLAATIARCRTIGIPLAWHEIKYGAWQWRTAYQLRRRYKDGKKREEWAEVLFPNAGSGRETSLPVYTWLELPLRWTDFLFRKRGANDDRM